MPRSDWEEKAAFMRDVGAVEAEWNTKFFGTSREEVLVKLTLAPAQRQPTTAVEPPRGPARQMAEAFMKQKREHDIRFAASHFKPRLEAAPQTTDDVPRAVRAREAAGGRASKK